MDHSTPRIALIHAVYVAMAPVEAAFQERWPQARRVNLVDDALPADLERDGRLTDAMRARIRRLAQHAITDGAYAVLFTCSAFGEAIAAAAAELPVPVLKPNEAMFEAALRAGRRIGMLATFGAAVPAMEEEFRALARERGIDASLEVVCLPEALAAAKAGDMATHDRLHVESAPRLAHCDAVMLAHFSNSRALEAVQAVLTCPVLTAPSAAIQTLQTRLRAAG
ncbi:aspartate/glutamate racemase family protein [Azohydromonas caseinilytica]|nr:aspartate/glutamate racemase family protein [Azohydromonas caseinilytica]